ncbi:MAG: alpha-glucosidase (family GH31 glycosyl hydrolase), partial [Limisphaerales bacterium]
MKAKGFTCFYIGKAKDLNIHFEQEKDYPTLFETKGNPEQVFKQWFKLMGISPPKAKPAIGWTSWYHYYIKKDEQIIKANLNGFIKKEIPIGVFQIDDGWQHALRDWIGTNSKFPSSLKIIIEEAKKAGIKPGLWLAPFIAKKTLGDLMASAMEFLREVVGEKIILACGVPLASAFGNVDYCRTGADIHLSWDHTLLRFLRNRERVS